MSIVVVLTTIATSTLLIIPTWYEDEIIKLIKEESNKNLKAELEQVPSMDGLELASTVSTEAPYFLGNEKRASNENQKASGFVNYCADLE